MDQMTGANVNSVAAEIAQLDLHERLRSFMSPPDDQKEYFLDLLARGEKELVQHENETLSILLQRVRSILSPIRRLPKELLLECLLYCLTSMIPSYFDVCQRPFAFKLARVCHHFRDLIFSSRSIWSSISTGVENIASYSDEAFLQTTLRLSGGYPLELDLYVDVNDEVNLSETRIFQLLVEHESPWRSLHITCDPWNTAKILQIFCYAMRDIEILKITTNCVPDDPISDVESIPLHLPNLTSVTLGSFQNLPQLPFSQIRKLSFVDEVPLVQIARDLPSFVNLEHLVISSAQVIPSEQYEYWEYGETSPAGMKEISSHLIASARTPNSVKSLDLIAQLGHTANMVSFKTLLRNLIAPNITSLKIKTAHTDSSRYCYDPWNISELMGFLEHSQCVLTTFSIDGIKTTPDALKSLLKLLPSVINFTLRENESRTYNPYIPGYSDVFYPGYMSDSDDDNYDWVASATPYRSDSSVDNSVLELMTTTSDRSQPVLPHLRLLILSTHGDAFEDDLFVKMVASRRRGADVGEYGVLESVQLKLTRREYTPDFLPPILEMRKEGLRVSINDTKGCQTDKELMKLLER